MCKTNHKKYKLVADKTDNITQHQNQMNSDELSETIVNALFRYEEEQKKKKKRQHINNRLKAFADMNMSKYFDDESKPIKNSFKFQALLVLKLIFAKEKNIALLMSNSEDEPSDYGVLSSSVNAITSLVFLLVEWFLYVLSVLCLLKLMIPCFSFSVMNFEGIDYLIYSISSFGIAKTVVRLLKIDCKYNADKNYMLNVLAIIVAVIAVIVSVVLR